MKNLYLLLLLCSLVSCATSNSNNSIDQLLCDEQLYDTIIDGEKVALYTLRNENMCVQLTNHGGRLVSMVVPDQDGVMRNVSWQEPSIAVASNAPYPYAGVLIGRFANRIGNGGKVTIDGKEFQLNVNALNHCAHGGEKSFSFRVWQAQEGVNDSGEPTLKMNLESKDGEEGFPGNLSVEALWTLTKDNSLKLEFTASTNSPTIVNLTSHPFFNLHGDVLKSTNSHLLRVNAKNYTPSAPDGILTGEIESLANTPWDFREPHTIGERVDIDDPQLNRGSGYDTNFVIDKDSQSEIALSAEMYEPATGILLELYSDQPALQLYGGPYQSQRSLKAHKNSNLPLRFGVALEPQNCPNAPNCSTFPNSVLMPGEQYKKSIIYKFSTVSPEDFK